MHSTVRETLIQRKHHQEKSLNKEICPESPQSHVYQAWPLFHQLFKPDLNLEQKKVFTNERSSTLTGLVWDNNTAIVTVMWKQSWYEWYITRVLKEMQQCRVAHWVRSTGKYSISGVCLLIEARNVPTSTTSTQVLQIFWEAMLI